MGIKQNNVANSHADLMYIVRDRPHADTNTQNTRDTITL